MDNDSRQWSNVRLFIGYAWNTFTGKLAVLVTSIGLVLAVVDFIFEDAIPEEYKQTIAIVSGVSLLMIASITLFRGIRNLLLEHQRIIVDKDRAWDDVRRLNEEKQELLNGSNSHRVLWSQGAATYGLGFYRHDVKCELHEDGSFKTDYYLEFAASHEGIDAIERYSWSSEIYEEGIFGFDADTKVQEGTILNPIIIKSTDSELLWMISSMPALTIGKRYNYSYSELYPPKTMAMTHEELRRREQKWEYYCTRIMHPTERLDIVVNFPAHFQPRKVDFDVWFTHRTGIRHKKECERVLRASPKFWKPAWGGATNQAMALNLTVENPVHGLTYVIKWIPPTVWG